MRNRKAIIVVSLVKESAKLSKEDIEKEILSELSKDLSKIPWAEKIDRVTVMDS